MVQTVLMVAEKPSLAESIAQHLSRGRAVKRQRALPVFEYTDYFRGQPAFFKVTSTTGHVFGCDFSSKYNSWDRVDEVELFEADILKTEKSGAKVVSHLRGEAQGCDQLVLWLDCDREGENICFEVMQVVRQSISEISRIWRAKFSAITQQELQRAVDTLGKPNKDVSDAVDCRQELDLIVGCAFTRFQTKFFHGKYGDLDSNVVSYGPCQTPTLGFCVQRHDEIVHFKPESFWKLVPVATKGGSPLIFEWHRGRIFDEVAARLLHRQVSRAMPAIVHSVSRTTESKPRPEGLNTVELLKVASRVLGISPAACMSVAEHLYISGYLSYPRTESTAYAPSFDIDSVLRDQQSNSIWGQFCKELLGGHRTRPKAGVDKGDHPPITPMKAASPSELHGDEWRIYEYVTRHFIASVSRDCKYTRTKITITIGGEVFTVAGKVVEDPGWTSVMPGSAVKDEKMPEVKQGDVMHISDVRLQPGVTRPPGYLTESDLIAMMEKHGIGTDASIPTHIQNICTRNYVKLEAGRTMVPTKLGIILVHGYHSIDPELVLPLVRSEVENYMTQIAEGRASKEAIMRYAVDLFRKKFLYFRENIPRMDALMEATFTKLAETGKFLCRCGICGRYMRHLDARPQRLYCQNCSVMYALPQGGAIKTYFEYKCPLDDFEVVICHIDGGKSFPLCPYCYNNPPFENFDGKVMTCAECTHPTCRESLTLNYVCDCVDDQCKGSMTFVTRSTGKWKICCNLCPAMLLLPPVATKVKVHDEECEECGARKISFVFPDAKSPLANHASSVVGCIFCNTLLTPHIQHVKGRVGNFGSRGARGRGGRGRGGRGRGRGRDRGP